MKGTLDELSLKLMQAIYNGDQYWALRHAAAIRRHVLSQKLGALRSLESMEDRAVETAAILEELTQLANVLGNQEQTEEKVA